MLPYTCQSGSQIQISASITSETGKLEHIRSIILIFSAYLISFKPAINTFRCHFCNKRSHYRKES